MSVGKMINQQFLGYHMFGEGFIYVFFPVNSAGMCRFLDCYGLLRFAIDIWAVSKTYSDLSIQFRDSDKSAHCSVGIRQARRFHAQYGSVMNVLDWGFWPHFWTDDGHLVLDPVEYILCTHFTLYFVYRIRRVSQKIRSYQHYIIIFHNFPVIFQIPWVFFYPVSAFAHLQGGPYASKARHVSGPGTWDWFFVAQNEIFIHYFIHYIFPKRF